MQRLVPVRVGLVVLATAFVVFNSICTVRGGSPASDAVVLALLGLFSVAIVGDTARPSGVVRAGAGAPTAAKPEDVQAALRRLAATAARRRGTPDAAPVDTRTPAAKGDDFTPTPGGEAS